MKQKWGPSEDNHSAGQESCLLWNQKLHYLFNSPPPQWHLSWARWTQFKSSHLTSL